MLGTRAANNIRIIVMVDCSNLPGVTAIPPVGGPEGGFETRPYNGVPDAAKLLDLTPKRTYT